MSTTLLAKKGKMGNTTFYQTTMKANTVITTIGLASEMDQWKDMTIDERMQRDINGTRVASELVPYIIKDPDWFFGSLIIVVYKGWEEIYFQDIQEVTDINMAAYKDALKDAGFLTLPDNKRLIALDGQHRLAALAMTIKGKNGIPGSVERLPEHLKESLIPHPEIGDADISVILIENKNINVIRKIFNKVNRYAKQTSRSDNIITSEDDIIAIVARRLFNSQDGPLVAIGGKELVNWKSNTISQRSKQLTTVSALYTITQTILSFYDVDDKTLVSDELLTKSYDIMKQYWVLCLENIDVFKTYIKCVREDRPVDKIRKESLLMKPVTHMALANAMLIVLKHGIDYVSIIDKINGVDWRFENPMWFNILVTNTKSKKMITKTNSLKQAGKLIAYMLIGDSFSNEEVNEVQEILNEAVGENQEVELPKIIE